ncbi:hypothetical protein [Citricoccus sp. GCM10030269]|uniref:hypothetical protein n=1 Tax=Citricoccus sp. GCM10030269 TaxID=3273388 RepID=UPI00360869BF
MTTTTQQAPTRLAILGLFVPPLAWLISLGMSWMVQDFTCTASMTAGAPPPETGLWITLLVMNAVLLALTVSSGFVSGRTLRTGRSTGVTLTTFLGTTGIILAVVFAFGILLIGMTPLALEVC